MEEFLGSTQESETAISLVVRQLLIVLLRVQSESVKRTFKAEVAYVGCAIFCRVQKELTHELSAMKSRSNWLFCMHGVEYVYFDGRWPLPMEPMLFSGIPNDSRTNQLKNVYD